MPRPSQDSKGPRICIARLASGCLPRIGKSGRAEENNRSECKAERHLSGWQSRMMVFTVER